MQQYYPIKFTPIFKEKIWGSKLKTLLNKESNNEMLGESWEISGVAGNVSIVSNGALKGLSINELIRKYKADILGSVVYQKFGDQFLLLIKYIDAHQDLSIQVHPDDKLAQKRHNSFGKTEMWYVVDAEKGSTLISGFKQPIDKEQYINAFNNGKLLSILKSHKIQQGDAIFIPSGNIHAICAGLLVAEIQQSSDVTYRIYDYNRKDDTGNIRELHTEMALEAINFEDVNDKLQFTNTVNEENKIVACKYFTINMLELNESFNRDLSVYDSFIVYMCVDGFAKLKCDNGAEEEVKKGDVLLIPACVDNIMILPADSVKLMEIFID